MGVISFLHFFPKYSASMPNFGLYDIHLGVLRRNKVGELESKHHLAL